jgi:hypothetical protein
MNYTKMIRRCSLVAVSLAMILALPVGADAAAVRLSEGPDTPVTSIAPISGFDPSVLVVGGGVFDIEVNFVSGLTPSQQAIFSQAEAMWESVIIGYLPGGTTFEGPLVINATGAAIDGVGGVLGSAGPTSIWDDGSDYLVSIEGAMTFDTADLANMETSGILDEVIAHEMGHVIGLGTLWNPSTFGFPGYQEVYVDGSGQYTGAAGLAAYKSEFSQPAAAFVPVELGGGAGTADAHWNEGDGGGLTGITNGDGKDMRNELMTGWINSPTFLSQTTISSFEDLGYEVTPEPATMSLLAIGALAIMRRRRRA